MMTVDHIGLNVNNLDESLDFYRTWFGLEVIARWDDPAQAFIGNGSFTLGLMEIAEYDFQRYTLAHLAFPVTQAAFPGWVEKIHNSGLAIVAGPKPQRGGETILFRDPSGNILEICYPSLQMWRQTHEPILA